MTDLWASPLPKVFDSRKFAFYRLFIMIIIVVFALRSQTLLMLFQISDFPFFLLRHFQWIWLQCLWQNEEKIAASEWSRKWRAYCIQFSISSWTGKWNITIKYWAIHRAIRSIGENCFSTSSNHAILVSGDRCRFCCYCRFKKTTIWRVKWNFLKQI